MSSTTGLNQSKPTTQKVQYRYKGGNYLLWLKKIGYAEDPGYIRAVMDKLFNLIILLIYFN